MPYIKKTQTLKSYIVICQGCKDCKNNSILNNGIKSSKLFGKQHIIKIIEQ